MAVMPVLQTPEIRAVATVYTGNPDFAAAGALIGVGMIKLTPEIVEMLLLFGIVGSPVTAAAIVIGLAIAIPL